MREKKRRMSGHHKSRNEAGSYHRTKIIEENQLADLDKSLNQRAQNDEETNFKNS